MQNVQTNIKEIAKGLYIAKKQIEATLFLATITTPLATYNMSRIYMTNLKVINDNKKAAARMAKPRLERKVREFYTRFTDEPNKVMDKVIEQCSEKQLQLLYALNRDIESTPFKVNYYGYNLKDFDKTLKLFNDKKFESYSAKRYNWIYDNGGFSDVKSQLYDLHSKVKEITREQSTHKRRFFNIFSRTNAMTQSLIPGTFKDRVLEH